MTKDEMLIKLRKGVRVRHRHFSEEEWMEQSKTRFVFEDGCSCEPYRFWETRKEASWETGWSVVS